MEGHLYIIETNYVDFALVYACGMMNRNSSSQMIWILGRNKTLQPEYITKSLEALKASKIVAKSWTKTSHNDCSVVEQNPTTERTTETDFEVDQ